MTFQLLEHQKRSGTKVYRYYSLAEPYREAGKNKKRVLAHLGALSLDQVTRIRQSLRIAANPDVQLLSPLSVVCTRTWGFLEVSVFHELWKKLGLDKVIESGRADVTLPKLLEILVINRVTNPQSKLGVTRWYGTTALERILEVPVETIDENRVYRCLPDIESWHQRIEKYIFEKLIRPADPSVSALYFYDLSSSYFEGTSVPCAAFSEHSKDHRPDRMQVVLGLLINEAGLPFSWDIFRGNQGDAPTLIEQIRKFKERFKLPKALLVFDRGFLSHENLMAVEAAGYEYLTGLDSPQIRDVLSFTGNDSLKAMNLENVEQLISEAPFWKRIDETGFYRECGLINNRKTVLLFDVDRYRSAILRREQKVEDFKKWVVQYNKELADFKKDASKSAVEKKVQKRLAKRGVEQYVSFELHAYGCENVVFQRRKGNPFPSQGYQRKVKSFQIIVHEKKAERLDGFFALITSEKSDLSSEQMVHAYRQKYLIESAFREMKTALKLRPWFVYKESHVRAHYTVCVLAYLLEKQLDLLLEKNGLKEKGWTLGRLKEQLSQYHLVELGIGEKSQTVLQKIPAELKELLKTLKLHPALTVPAQN